MASRYTQIDLRSFTLLQTKKSFKIPHYLHYLPHRYILLPLSPPCLYEHTPLITDPIGETTVLFTAVGLPQSR